MRLINKYVERFKHIRSKPYKEGFKQEEIILNGYRISGEKIKVIKKEDGFYTLKDKKVNIVLWEYITEYKYEFYHIKKRKPDFSKQNQYIIGVDKLGNEFLVYEKDKKYYMYCNDKEAFFVLWRYIRNINTLNL